MFRYYKDVIYPYLYFDTKNYTETLFTDGGKLEKQTFFFQDLIEAFKYPNPMGDMLCKCLNTLSEIFALLRKNDFHGDYSEIAKTVNRIIDAAFPKRGGNNTSSDELGTLMRLEFCYYTPAIFDMESADFNQLINFFNFAQLCTENSAYHTLERLYDFSALVSYKYKNGFVISDKIPVIQRECKLTSWEIKGYLDGLYTENIEESANPRYYELYSINSLSDFIAVSLRQLLLSGRSISRCRICQRFFIPNKFGTIYCNQPNPKYNNRTCRVQGKLQKQLKRTQMSETQRMHRSIAQMLRSGVYAEQINYEELSNFLDNSKEYRAQIKDGKMSETDYIKWLKSFYKRKYKKHS